MSDRLTQAIEDYFDANEAVAKARRERGRNNDTWFAYEQAVEDWARAFRRMIALTKVGERDD